MRINFLLPDLGNRPVGGYKVVYEYAKRFAAEGHEARILYSTVLAPPSGLVDRLRALRKFLRKRASGAYSCAPWYQLPPSVEERLIPDMRERHIPDGDVIFASSWETAEFVTGYGAAKGRKLYLIQHFEDWSGEKERVLATWKAPLEKIVIAPWLAEIAEGLGERSHLIENGFDFSYFTLDRPIAAKDRARVSMLYHTIWWKGSEDGIEALKIAKRSVPELRAEFFGVPERPEGLPDWIGYHHTPDRETHNRIYNDSAIFVGPSLKEGFCLTPPEAMMCGCAVACTDIGGYTVVAREGETALLSPPRDPEALAANIVRLVRDDELRIRIATEGHRRIQAFTWDRAYAKMRELVLGGTA